MSYKAIAAARELADALSRRLSAAAVSTAVTVVQSNDTDGNPLITVGTLASTNACALIKVMDVSQPLAKDVFGNTAQTFCPIKVMLATEAEPLGGLLPKHTIALLGEPAKRGILLEWYQSASGAAPAVGTFVVANLVATFDSLYWAPLASQ